MKYLKYFEKSIVNNELKDFFAYVEQYYSKPYGFHPLFTIKQMSENIEEYINKRKKLDDWGNGDSFDREVFRDYLFVKLGIKQLNDVEYSYQIKKLLTPIEIDQFKYNL